MTGVGKDERGMMEGRERKMEMGEHERKRERRREKQTNSEMTHFLYCEKPTQQTHVPHTRPHSPTHTDL